MKTTINVLVKLHIYYKECAPYAHTNAHNTYKRTHIYAFDISLKGQTITSQGKRRHIKLLITIFTLFRKFTSTQFPSLESFIHQLNPTGTEKQTKPQQNKDIIQIIQALSINILVQHSNSCHVTDHVKGTQPLIARGIVQN